MTRRSLTARSSGRTRVSRPVLKKRTVRATRRAAERVRWTDEKDPRSFFSEQRSQQLATKNGSGVAAASTAAEIG